MNASHDSRAPRRCSAPTVSSEQLHLTFTPANVADSCSSASRQHPATLRFRRVTSQNGTMRLKTFNGAPPCASLDFSPEALLTPDEAARFLRPGTLTTDISQREALKWRCVVDKEERLRSEWSQPYLPCSGFRGTGSNNSFSVPGTGASFEADPGDTTNLDTVLTIDEAPIDNSDFMYQSLILHDALLSSQIAVTDAVDPSTDSQSFVGMSFNSISSVDGDSLRDSKTEGPILQVPATLKLTALGALPSSAHLRRIYPQTLTPNLLCVLTAPPEDREVFVKKGGYKMRLREITVADDTKNDFKITFWQKPSRDGESQNDLGRTLQRVKTGDILLLRNIALNTFRDDVYGQSLNPSIARVQTTIEVLKSGRGISNRQLGTLPSPVVAAFMRVKKWATSHIASEIPSHKRKDESQRSTRSSKRSLRSSNSHDEVLPPDTMESV